MHTSRGPFDGPPLPLELAPLSICLGNHVSLEFGTRGLWVAGQQRGCMRTKTRENESHA